VDWLALSGAPSMFARQPSFGVIRFFDVSYIPLHRWQVHWECGLVSEDIGVPSGTLSEERKQHILAIKWQVKEKLTSIAHQLWVRSFVKYLGYHRYDLCG
jgi:hypothetical protein